MQTPMAGPGEDALEAIVGRLLKQRKLTLALAESCTGGLISHRITDIAGSSAYYLGSVTAYSNEIKEMILGVQRRTLRDWGAVSAQTAQEMASRVRHRFSADLGLAATGVAGPGGGTPDKPVGLTYIALAAANGEWVERHDWSGSRWENKMRSADAALDLLRRHLMGQL